MLAHGLQIVFRQKLTKNNLSIFKQHKNTKFHWFSFHLLKSSGCKDNLNIKILGLQNATPVAFHVQRSTHFRAPAPINVEFDRVQYEIGGVWNRPGHTFIVPVKGVYVFHLTILHGGTSSHTRVGIMRDGTLIQQAYVHYYNSYSYRRSASASAVVEMEPFNQVYCRLLSGYLYSDSNYPLHFVGYLLYSLE